MVVLCICICIYAHKHMYILYKYIYVYLSTYLPIHPSIHPSISTYTVNQSLYIYTHSVSLFKLKCQRLGPESSDHGEHKSPSLSRVPPGAIAGSLKFAGGIADDW